MTVEALAEGIVRIAVARDDLGDPRDLDPARPRSARLHADRLRRRRAHARPGAGRGDRHSARARAAPSRQLLGARPAGLATIKHDDVRTRVGPLRERLAVAGDCSRRWRRAARRQLELEGFSPAQQRLLRSLDLRYRGQAFELNVALGEAGDERAGARRDRGRVPPPAPGGVRPRRTPTPPIELVNARLTAYGLVAKPAGRALPEPRSVARRRAGRAPAGVVRRARRTTARCGSASGCPSGARAAGPGASSRSSAPPPSCRPGWRGGVDEHGNLRFEREGRRDRSHHAGGGPRGVRVDRARDAGDARAHRVLVHPLRGRGLLLRPHGRRRADRGHVQGRRTIRCTSCRSAGR